MSFKVSSSSWVTLRIWIELKIAMRIWNSTTENKRVDLRRNDTVKVITGRDKGKEGRVLRVFPNDAKVLVEHVMMVKKHVRPNPQRNIKGGIAEQESRIAISNVQLVCPTCGPCGSGMKCAATARSAYARSAGRRWISRFSNLEIS